MTVECLYVCGIYVYLYRCVHKCVYMEDRGQYWLPFSIALYLIFGDWVSHWSGCPTSSRGPPYFVPHCLDIGVKTWDDIPSFFVGAGICTLVLMLTQQTLYQLSHLSSTYFWYHYVNQADLDYRLMPPDSRLMIIKSIQLAVLSPFYTLRNWVIGELNILSNQYNTYVSVLRFVSNVMLSNSELCFERVSHDTDKC